MLEKHPFWKAMVLHLFDFKMGHLEPLKNKKSIIVPLGHDTNI